MRIEIIRDENAGEDGLLGVLWMNGMRLIQILDEAWRNNQVGNSCLRPGTYRWEIVNGAHWGVPEVIRIYEDIPERDGFYIHPGNTVEDTEGCTLPGLSRGYADGKKTGIKRRAVLDSRKALVYLIKQLGDNRKGELIIRDQTGVNYG